MDDARALVATEQMIRRWTRRFPFLVIEDVRLIDRALLQAPRSSAMPGFPTGLAALESDHEVKLERVADQYLVAIRPRVGNRDFSAGIDRATGRIISAAQGTDAAPA